MKRILILIFALLSLQVGAQNTIDHLGKIRMRYNNGGSPDTLLIQFSGDSVLYDANNPFHKFAGGVIMDSIKLNGVWKNAFVGSQWITSGSNIYYNTGNVGINNSSPSYTLDVGGLIGANNIETNSTSRTTRIGIESGKNENETQQRNNTFVGFYAGYSNTTGVQNTFVGYEAGYSGAGNYNTLIGYKAGRAISSTNMYNTIIGNNAGSLGLNNYSVFIGSNSGYNLNGGNYNVFLGTNSGYNQTSGGGNTYLGHLAGYYNLSGSNNVFIGHKAGLHELGSDKLFIDNRNRTSEENARLSSLIYGKFDPDTMNQFVDINGALYHTAILAEIYKTGTTVAQSIPAGTTPTKVTAFTDNKYGIHCTADAANDKITITKAGYYDFTLGLSYKIGTSGVTCRAHIFVNGVEDASLHSVGKPVTANDPRSTAIVGSFHVTTVPCDVDYRVTHDNGGSVNIEFEYCNMKVNYIGE